MGGLRGSQKGQVEDRLESIKRGSPGSADEIAVEDKVQGESLWAGSRVET